MSFVRITNEKIIAAANKHIAALKAVSPSYKVATVDLLEKLADKAKNNYERSIDLNDHDFCLIQKYL